MANAQKASLIMFQAQTSTSMSFAVNTHLWLLSRRPRVRDWTDQVPITNLYLNLGARENEVHHTRQQHNFGAIIMDSFQYIFQLFLVYSPFLLN